MRGERVLVHWARRRVTTAREEVTDEALQAAQIREFSN